MEKLLSVKEVAKALALSENRVRDLITSGQLPAEKMGKLWYVKERDIGLVADRPPGRRERSAKLFIRRYPKSSPNWGQSFMEARSGKNGTGRCLKKIDLKEDRLSKVKGLERVNAQKKIFSALQAQGYRVVYDLDDKEIVLIITD